MCDRIFIGRSTRPRPWLALVMTITGLSRATLPLVTCPCVAAARAAGGSLDRGLGRLGCFGVDTTGARPLVAMRRNLAGGETSEIFVSYV
jgi:hypothetical protein